MPFWKDQYHQALPKVSTSCVCMPSPCPNKCKLPGCPVQSQSNAEAVSSCPECNGILSMVCQFNKQHASVTLRKGTSIRPRSHVKLSIPQKACLTSSSRKSQDLMIESASAAKAIEDQNALARSQIDLAQQALETQRRQHEQVMGALGRLEQHLTGYSPAMQPPQVCQ